jgi:aldehyde dehydrogenase (NAD+)
MREYLTLHVGGEWIDPVSPRTIDVVNPAIEEVCGTVAAASTEEMRAPAALADGCQLDLAAGHLAEWRIARRVVVSDRVRDHGGSADLAQGVLGAPWLGDHHTGDHSEILFADPASARP